MKRTVMKIPTGNHGSGPQGADYHHTEPRRPSSRPRASGRNRIKIAPRQPVTATARGLTPADPTPTKL
jgi:hypothetical protein